MKPTRVLATLLISFTALTFVLGQKPEIASIEPISGPAGAPLTISGNGFSTTPANLVVTFGVVNAKILTSTNNLIEVVIPAGATHGGISVTNLSSGLIGYSSQQFMLSYQGTNFRAAKLDAQIDFLALNELFDLCLCDFDGDSLVDVATTQSNIGEFFIFQNTSTNNAILIEFYRNK